MSRRVRLRPAAERDLERLAKFIVDENPDAAERLGRRLRESALSLRERAERGRPAAANFRELVVPFGRSRYVIRYLVSEETVTVTRIWNSRENRAR